MGLLSVAGKVADAYVNVVLLPVTFPVWAGMSVVLFVADKFMDFDDSTLEDEVW